MADSKFCHCHELDDAAKLVEREARYKELEIEYDRLSSWLRTASCFEIKKLSTPKILGYDLPMKERLTDEAPETIRSVFD